MATKYKISKQSSEAISKIEMVGVKVLGWLGWKYSGDYIFHWLRRLDNFSLISSTINYIGSRCFFVTLIPAYFIIMVKCMESGFDILTTTNKNNRGH